MDDNSGMDSVTREAFERLLVIAEDDTGSSSMCADFILAWWNAKHQGGWNPVVLCSIHQSIADDMLTVLKFLTRQHAAVYTYEYRDRLKGLMQRWRSAG